MNPVCIEGEAAEGDWVCGETRVVTCEEAASDDIDLVVELEDGECDDADLAGVDGPFTPGVYEIDIEDEASDTVVCTARLEVTDDDAPEVDTDEITLWPPNHKFHDISILDCIDVVDCDENWEARIIAVASDEPVNANGDGNTEPDIVEIDATTVSLRSERQGGSNGRVYTIDLEVEDGGGNVAEAICYVSVVHDQSGAAAIDDGPAYVVDWPAP